MNKSSYLQPQLEINDPLKELMKKPFYVSQEGEFRSELNDSIPDGWDEFIHEVKKNNINISQTQKQKIQNSATYKWKYEGGKIILQFNTENKITGSDFQIDTTSIHSNIISGIFLYPILNHSIADDSENGKVKIILNLDTEKKQFDDDDWPVLISGGDDIDSFSSFLLADASMRLNEIDYFFYWGIKSALKGCTLAQKSLGIMYLTLKDFDKSMYWFTNLSHLNKDEFARTVLAQFLFESHDDNLDPKLAENILISLAKEGTKEALYYLGYLHLQKLDNWINDEKLAVRYLEEAAQKGDKPSLQLLAECYSNGIGCDKDEEKAMMYAQMANDESDENNQINKNRNTGNDNQQIGSNDSQGFPFASALVSVAAIAGTVLMGSYIFKRIFRK